MKKKVVIPIVAAVVVAAIVVCVVCFGKGGNVKESITVFNCFDYIDESVLSQFTEETGIKVNYANYTTNEEMYTKLNAGAANYDVIFPSDYMVERMLNENLLAKLDFSAMPNTEGLADWLKTTDYDPTGEYTVPYMWGTFGILYNTTMVDEPITSWTAMFDEKYVKNVFMMNSVRDTLGATLKMLGYSMNTRDPQELEEAKQALIEQKQKGIVKGYLLDETKDKMIAGEAALAIIYSGDAIYSMSENPDLAYVVPEEGSNVWIDAMCVPAASQHIEAAQQFINFMCRTDVGTRNLEYIHYSTPLREVAANMSEEERNNLTLNPTQDIIDRCEFFHDISQDIEMYDKIWMEILA